MFWNLNTTNLPTERIQAIATLLKGWNLRNDDPGFSGKKHYGE
jgi:hypothetical protein